VPPEAALSGYDDQLSGLDRLDRRALADGLTAVAAAARELDVNVLCGGARLLAYLTYAANPRIPSGVWRSHLISRAAETQRFVLAANAAEPDQHCPSMVITPRGEVVAEATTSAPCALHAELDLAEVSDLVLSQQREDVVGISYPA